MPRVGEFSEPVSYSGGWIVLALVLPLLVVGWYAGVGWWTRDRTDSPRPGRLGLWIARREHLRELDRIEAAVAGGELSPRHAHQAVSATVRSFAAAAGPVDARTMNLRQLRHAAPQVVGVVEAAYPPAFGPDEDIAPAEQLDIVLGAARRFVGELGR
jgi:hypothetical protein